MARRVVAPPPALPGLRYVRPLGSGGFSDVYLYDQDLPRRVVATKVLVGDIVTPEVLRTFNAEADILARLSAHPSVVTIYQAGISSDGRPYLVMEYCPETMSSRYRRGPLGTREVLDIGVRIGGALETAHRAGLLHRDIKPSNILLTSLGAPVLADFGIAAALAGDDEIVAMSVPWSAPEVLEETVGGSVASEVWSLAASLYTLLAGASPFESSRREDNTRDRFTARIVRARYVPIDRPDVPDSLQRILATAMAKDPARRQPTVLALAEELRRVQIEIGALPSPLDVATAAWAEGESPLDLGDGSRRGPVVSTVATRSRRTARAERAERALADAPRDRDGVLLRGRRRLGPLAAGLIGAGIAIAAIAAIGIVLRLTGLL